MPVEIQIIRACEFVQLSTSGVFDFNGTRALLIEMADACRKRGVERAAIDIREATSNLTRNDLAALGKTFNEMAVSRRLRLSIIHRHDQGGRARLFAFFSAMRGRNVRAFEDFEEALVWLSTEIKTGAKAAAAEDTVPIRTEPARKRIPVKDA